jgi:preprotein translocase subunit SecE
MDRIKLTAAGLIVAAAVVLFYYFGDVPLALRIGGVILAVAAAAAVAATTALGREAVEFIKGADLERRKVVWPTRRETLQGTLVVIVMVVLVGLYLWILDTISFWLIYDLILGSRIT